MLRIIQNTSPAGAKSYYSTSDYYSEGQELTGYWRGNGAQSLGLSGEIRREDWDALCDNRDPATGLTLTQRQKRGRRVGYDFNWHAPKSVSLLYGLTGDERILEAFRGSVDATMQDMEAEMQTRVRTEGRNDNRTTGNAVWGEFIHLTARPVDGVPDPHLHAHCFVFNTTWDGKEERWKAGEFAGLKRDAPFFEAVFHSRLARRLEELGLPVARTRTGWEISGIPETALKRFSRRTSLIEETAREKGITDAEAKGELGAKTRERKSKHLTLRELREVWQERLSDGESEALRRVKELVGGESLAEDGRAAKDAVQNAVGHCFERNSVVPERILLARALKQAAGVASPETVQHAYARENLVWGERNGRRMVTTREVLAEEKSMIDFARKGRGTCRTLGDTSHVFTRTWLNDGQRKAAQRVLTSRDRVTLVRGAAGVGKTSMMKETVEGIEAAGKRVFVFAPSADASRGVLRSEGFAEADTVARLLKDERLQQRINGQVIWVDEAGLLSTRTTAELFALASKIDARVVLSGDRRQHGSVERGAALRLLEEEAGLVPAEIREIQRQKGDYKDAVQALSEGRTEDGFRQLDQLGWVREVPETERYRTLAADYVATVGQGKSALVVSPTHMEGEWITDKIREELKRTGRLGSDEHVISTLENANLTEAERADPVSYSPGDVIEFHQNAKGFRKNERVRAGAGTLPLDEAARFQVFHPSALAVAPGDVLRITRNGTTEDGNHRLNNGALYTVRGFNDEGNLVLTNGWRISKDYGHLAHGYCVTSYASQGHTVDRVLVGMSSQSFPASSREQFYVSVSRGRESATIYTDDKHALLQAAERSDDRLTATEFVSGRDHAARAVTVQRIAAETAVREAQERESLRVKERERG